MTNLKSVQLYSLLSLDDFDSGVNCVLRQLGHLFATLFPTIYPSALALSWSDWSSSTLASALDIMQGEHSVFQCIFIFLILKSNNRDLFVQHNIPGTRSTQHATLDQDCSSLLLVGAPRPSQVIITGEKRVSKLQQLFELLM